jgi:hypothetical protein
MTIIKCFAFRLAIVRNINTTVVIEEYIGINSFNFWKGERIRPWASGIFSSNIKIAYTINICCDDVKNPVVIAQSRRKNSA